jgi:cell division protein FtsA
VVRRRTGPGQAQEVEEGKQLEYEAILVALDVGTSKVVVLVGEVTNDGALDIIGKGAMPTTGVKKGLVNNIDQTVSSIHGAIAQAERLSGLRLEAAFVGVGGDHLESLNSRGTVAVSGAHREITREDIERATEVARAVTIPSNREVLHVLPRDFTVDGQEGVKDPEGMSAIRLEVTTHIVHGGATALQNLTKCVRQAGVRPDELVVSAIASGESVLTETERELGVAMADIGAGTTDLALYAEGSPFHTSVIPLGGVNVTNDIAIGLRTNLTDAELLKIQFGSADAAGTSPDAEASVEIVADGVSRPARKSDVIEIVDARMRELFEKIGEEMSENASAHRLPAGLVLTGGAAQLANAAEIAREVLGIPVRVASPEGVGGLTDHLLTPQYSTAIGLLLWAARVVTTEDLQRYEPPPRTQSWDRLREAVRQFFP